MTLPIGHMLERYSLNWQNLVDGILGLVAR